MSTAVSIPGTFSQVSTFKAGVLGQFVQNWKNITSDNVILNNIQGTKLEFINNKIPIQNVLPLPCHLKMSVKEQALIDTEIQKLLSKGVVEHSFYEKDQYLSTIFLTPKRDGSHRMIFNMKELNKFIVYKHFKMDNLESALKLVTPNSYLASIDLRDAYYSVPIFKGHRKFLKFQWKGKLFQYTCYAQGFSAAPRLFTKITKPIYAALRKLGHTNMGYIDDSLLQSQSYNDCLVNIKDTVYLFKKLGFFINETKSVFIPCQKLVFLGFIIDSVLMIVLLVLEKQDNIILMCTKLYNKVSCSILELAKVIGTLVSSFPGVEFGKLHYRHLELAKINNLKYSKGDFAAVMNVSQDMRLDLIWWITNIKSQKRDIVKPPPSYILRSDASLEGWGAIVLNSNQKTGGRWLAQEQLLHINVLELLAAFYALKSFCKHLCKTHIQIQMDNSTAVSYIEHMGGIKSLELNSLAKEIWLWCIEREIWISACHIPGSQNFDADFYSRHFSDNTEWSLCTKMYDNICCHFNIFPSIDMFASRLNRKVNKFVSWRPDPEAYSVDAFSTDWNSLLMYAFPPFRVIPNVVQKLRQHSHTQILAVIPLWQSQPWFVQILELAVADPVIIQDATKYLTLPGSSQVFPLKNLKLVALILSNNQLDVITYQNGLKRSSLQVGDVQLRDSIAFIRNAGAHFVLRNKLMPCHLV